MFQNQLQQNFWLADKTPRRGHNAFVSVIKFQLGLPAE